MVNTPQIILRRKVLAAAEEEDMTKTPRTREVVMRYMLVNMLFINGDVLVPIDVCAQDFIPFFPLTPPTARGNVGKR